MNIAKKVISHVNKEVRDYFGLSSSIKIKWEKMEKGFSNTKFLLCLPDGKPLAVCKIYSGDQIVSENERLKNEKQALEIFGGRIAPRLIWTDNKTLLCYQYLEGKGISEFSSNEQQLLKNEIEKTLEFLHHCTLKELNATRDIYDLAKSYYLSTISKYENACFNIPKSLLQLTYQVKERIEEIFAVAKKKKLNISFIHGDLVPANIIIQEKKVFFIDFEYFRVDLSLFDYVYFNYFANKHNLNIDLDVSYPKELKDFYRQLIELLNNYWFLLNDIQLKTIMEK